MKWLAQVYVNALNIIHYMHDKYCYEKLQMALHDKDVKRCLRPASPDCPSLRIHCRRSSTPRSERSAMKAASLWTTGGRRLPEIRQR